MPCYSKLSQHLCRINAFIAYNCRMELTVLIPSSSIRCHLPLPCSQQIFYPLLWPGNYRNTWMSDVILSTFNLYISLFTCKNFTLYVCYLRYEFMMTMIQSLQDYFLAATASSTNSSNSFPALVQEFWKQGVLEASTISWLQTSGGSWTSLYLAVCESIFLYLFYCRNVSCFLTLLFNNAFLSLKYCYYHIVHNENKLQTPSPPASSFHETKC